MPNRFRLLVGFVPLIAGAAVASPIYTEGGELVLPAA